MKIVTEEGLQKYAEVFSDNIAKTFAFKKSIPKKISTLENDENFIKKTVEDLVNYYKKSETYSKSEVDELIGKFTSLNKVDSLPEVGQSNIIYLVPSEDQEEKNIYDEYIYTDSKWEKIGSTKVDLTNYWSKEELVVITEAEVKEIAQSHIHNTLKRVEYAPIDSSNCYSVEYRCSEDDEIVIEKHDVPHDYGKPNLTSGDCVKCGEFSKPSFGG